MAYLWWTSDLALDLWTQRLCFSANLGGCRKGALNEVTVI